MGNSRTWLRRLVGAALVLGLGSCDRSDTAQTPPPEATTPPGGINAYAAETPIRTMSVADISTLDDAQRAAVLLAIDQRIADEAQLADDNAGSQDIKQVAHELLVLHQDELKNEEAIFARQGIDPVETPISRKLESDTDNAVSVMRGMTGAAFDHDFVDEQIRAHREGLDLVDRMFPGVANAGFKAEIVRNRPTLTVYLGTLKGLQRGVGVTERQGAGPAEKPR